MADYNSLTSLRHRSILLSSIVEMLSPNRSAGRSTETVCTSDREDSSYFIPRVPNHRGQAVSERHFQSLCEMSATLCPNHFPVYGTTASLQGYSSTSIHCHGNGFTFPFSLKKGHTRKPAWVNGYVCLFVCLTTRAVHLEIVMDLTTEAFMAAFGRFVARRGRLNTILSDNGTNFVGGH